MKTYKITISGKEIEVTQNEDGSFNKPDIVKELEPIGTALKPAFEPICMAMKPLSEKNYVANVLKYGTGGINIDESRVEAHDGNTTARKRAEVKDTSAPFGKGYEMGGNGSELGRFPANLIHDNSEEVRECFPETKSGGGNKATKTAETFLGTGFGGTDNSVWECDSGNASRFFKSIIYQAKASKSERNKGLEDFETKQSVGGGGGIGDYLNDVNSASGKFGSEKAPAKNNHPTVKPIALMEYLIKMITKPGGIVLDPFAGSGSTLVASKQNGYNYIGIEMTPEYIPIIEARLKAVKLENKLF